MTFVLKNRLFVCNFLRHIFYKNADSAATRNKNKSDTMQKINLQKYIC